MESSRKDLPGRYCDPTGLVPTAAPSWEESDQSHTVTCRLVALDEHEVIGWAALTPVSGCIYACVADVSVYIAEEARENGIGKKLMQALI